MLCPIRGTGFIQIQLTYLVECVILVLLLRQTFSKQSVPVLFRMHSGHVVHIIDI